MNKQVLDNKRKAGDKQPANLASRIWNAYACPDTPEEGSSMLKPRRWIILLPGLLYTMPAPAILLDCKQNNDGTYLCVEIEGSQAIEPAKSTVPEIDTVHIEQARKECIYREPRKRMGSGSAVRSEARKSAQEDYDRCVADRAWELKNLENRSDQH